MVVTKYHLQVNILDGNVFVMKTNSDVPYISRISLIVDVSRDSMSLYGFFLPVLYAAVKRHCQEELADNIILQFSDCIDCCHSDSYCVLQLSFIIEPRHEKTCFCHMRTTKAQISLRIRAG